MYVAVTAGLAALADVFWSCFLGCCLTFFGTVLISNGVEVPSPK